MKQILIEQRFIYGMPNGIIEVKKHDWNGICYNIPYISVKEIKEIEILSNNPAIYFLFGEKDGKESVYVGETESVFDRLTQHKYKTDKVFEEWNSAVVFVGMSDYPLEKSQAKFLENYFYNECIKAYGKTKKYQVFNGNNPTKSKLTENSKIKAENFAESIKFLLNILGYKIFDEAFLDEKEAFDDWYVIKTKDVEAYGKRTLNGFLVKKGSKTAKEYSQSTTECFKIFGEKLENENIIIDNIFVVDYEFKTPSGAATAILKHNSNGLETWKRDGKTLKEIEEGKHKK